MLGCRPCATRTVSRAEEMVRVIHPRPRFNGSAPHEDSSSVLGGSGSIGGGILGPWCGPGRPLPPAPQGVLPAGDLPAGDLPASAGHATRNAAELRQRLLSPDRMLWY